MQEERWSKRESVPGDRSWKKEGLRVLLELQVGVLLALGWNRAFLLLPACMF